MRERLPWIASVGLRSSSSWRLFTSMMRLLDAIGAIDIPVYLDAVDGGDEAADDGWGFVVLDDLLLVRSGKVVVLEREAVDGVEA